MLMKSKEWKPLKDIRATLEAANNLITESCMLDEKWSEAYSEPCQTSDMQLFAKLVSGLKLWWWWMKNQPIMVSHSKFSLLQSRRMASFFSFEMLLIDAVRDWYHKSFHAKDLEVCFFLSFSKCRAYSKKLDIRLHLILAKKRAPRMIPPLFKPAFYSFLLKQSFSLKRAESESQMQFYKDEDLRSQTFMDF